ncbi:P-loop containing nucleoside triphosphate hydrolase protein [Emericellopsis atlantica]|uniref:P-loop containing nucleoside triphosphate hydrolase protein n=1 Tax=Emericellopsis atlantica TaxID=2614577 RepID=A0A9P7ZFE1_9HYPO|nr:P-loop containing nucleoside triphosphate hydrolase protein [Emericellopsis atlantica]KAG9251149.1 P-loop containing nucleoside triphosphate hydrolase protein [Emericellopsis atlantica]
MLSLEQHHDPHFTVSWLLGLAPRPGRCPAWAAQYEDDISDTSVSFSLGLIPSPASDGCVGEDESIAVEMEVAESEQKAETYENDNDADDASLRDDMSGRRSRRSRVHATAEFLDLCEKMEEMVVDIETSRNTKDDASDIESIDGVSPEDDDAVSPARDEWLRLKRVEFAENKYLDRLMSLPGLEEAKSTFLHARARIKAAQRRETSLQKDNFDMVFTGNQGTGKSTLARLYAKFLLKEGLFKPRPYMYENGVYKCSAYYFSKTDIINAAGIITSKENGCIVIIDDAHMIDNHDSDLWNLHIRLKELPGIIVLVMAGSADDGLSKQIQYRVQVQSQLRVIELPNYTEEQLRVIFRRMVQLWFARRMKLEGGVDDRYVRTLICRLRRDVSDADFTNVWHVKQAFVEALRRQVERFARARKDGDYLDDYFMTKEDLLGEKPRLEPDKSEAWRELQGLPGLDEVKRSILGIINQASHNWEREMRGLAPLSVSLHRVFLGNPGTGKTTVAKLYGRILADFGLLSKGDLVLKSPADLMDKYVSTTERNTKKALAQAKGSVLILDDAHTLDSAGDRGIAVIDTLVAEVTGAPGEDRCVVLCGYPEQMKDMYANGNPGLARRFSLDMALSFLDFTPERLGQVLDLKLNEASLTMTEAARKVAMDMLTRASHRPGFGNGAEVVNLLANAALSRARRMNELHADTPADSLSVDANPPIEPADVDPDWGRHTRAAANTRALFDGFVGFEEIIAKFEGYQYMAQGMRLRGIDPRPYIPFTYVFKGPPGTGKTSTARKVGQIFYDMGLLSAPDVVEVSASALTGEYVGQTGPKTRRLLESALGKVLFIDEAYRLALPHSYGDEAVSELVDAMTKPTFARKMIVVLAGYDDSMDRLMRVNPGLKSRFATDIHFTPLRAEQCLESLRSVVSKVGIRLEATSSMDSTTRDTLLTGLAKLGTDESWASGRSVETLGERVIAHVFKECAMKGYTGAELEVNGRDLISILADSGMEERSGRRRPVTARADDIGGSFGGSKRFAACSEG